MFSAATHPVGRGSRGRCHCRRWAAVIGLAGAWFFQPGGGGEIPGPCPALPRAAPMLFLGGAARAPLVAGCAAPGRAPRRAP